MILYRGIAPGPGWGYSASHDLILSSVLWLYHFEFPSHSKTKMHHTLVRFPRLRSKDNKKYLPRLRFPPFSFICWPDHYKLGLLLTVNDNQSCISMCILRSYFSPEFSTFYKILVATFIFYVVVVMCQLCCCHFHYPVIRYRISGTG